MSHSTRATTGTRSARHGRYRQLAELAADRIAADMPALADRFDRGL